VSIAAPPRPPRPNDPVTHGEFEALVEALIEEARKRAQRRRRRNAAVVTSSHSSESRSSPSSDVARSPRRRPRSPHGRVCLPQRRHRRSPSSASLSIAATSAFSTS
jgi:hypothetical protein